MNKLKRAILTAFDRMPGTDVLCRLIRPFNPSRRVTRALEFKGQVTVRLQPGRPFRIVTGASDLFWKGLDGYSDRHSLRLWSRLCGGGGVVFDVGAHKGLFSLAAASSNPRLKVYAFEPLPGNYSNLRRNVDANGFSAIVCSMEAVSDSTGEAELNFDDEEGSIAMLNGRQMRRSVTVPVVTLEEVISRHRRERLDAVKIDVEGHEPHVLRGLGPYLHKLRPFIIAEILNDGIGSAVHEVIGGGYAYYWINEEGALIERETLRRISDKYTDYLLCPCDKRSSLEDFPD